MAKISELKQAVESAFRHLPTEGLGEVSWEHAWVHFCLSFRGQKLLNDVDCIKSYGIMDGDELHFVRRELMTCNIRKESPKSFVINLCCPKCNQAFNSKLCVSAHVLYCSKMEGSCLCSSAPTSSGNFCINPIDDITESERA